MVVIAILAAITIVAYNGIQERAKNSSAQSAASQANKKVALWLVDNPNQAPDVAQFTTLVGETNIGKYQYTPGTNGAFCVTATIGNVSYYSSNTQTNPVAGACDGHGVNGVAAITNYALNPSFETNSSSFGRSGASPAPANFSRTTLRSHRGVASLQQDITGNGQSGLAIQLPSSGDRLRVNGGESASWSLWMYTTKPGIITPYCDGSLVAGGYAGLSGAPNVTVPANSWTKVVGYGTLASGSGDMYVGQCGAYGLPVVAGDQLWFDEFMVNKGITQQVFADGDSPSWIWNGTVNNSTSTGPPL